MEPAEQSQGLVATLCGYDDWPSLLAAVDAARQRVAARWDSVKGSK
jgi:glutamate-ammonia-ligase adenylyltransferase